MRSTFLYLIVPVILSFLSSCGSEPPAEETIACDFLPGLAAPSGFRCGIFRVPEDHNDPGSREIQITYFILEALEETDEHPLIYFTGGPGGHALTPGRIRSWIDHPLRQKRDVILFDQRGTGFSSPLPPISDHLFQIASLDIDMTGEMERVQELFTNVHQLAEDTDTDLSCYNSFQNARDVGRLMEVLGYEKYSLFGGSYGTRLARIVQDMFPERLHASILNSPAPLGGDFLLDRLVAYEKALSRVIDWCREDPGCRRSYPDLLELYIFAMDSLVNKPEWVIARGDTFHINSQDAMYLVRRKLYRTDSRESVPRFVKALAEREKESLREAVEGELLFSDTYNSTMWLSVERYEMFDPELDSASIAQVYDTSSLLHSEIGLFHSSRFQAGRLHDSELDARKKQFSSSDTPTLIMVNHYDPVTPPEFGEIMARGLSNYNLYVLDEGGHGGGNAECRNKVIAQFLEDPTREPDVSCLNLYVQ